MNKDIWKDIEEFKKCLNNYSSITGKKTLKKYREKFGELTINKWASLTGYYRSVFSDSFVTIEEFFNRNRDYRRSNKFKAKKKRKQKKEKSIKFYRTYINSKERQDKRVKYFIQYKFQCQCCKKDFIESELCLHHHTYTRVGKEKHNDLVVVCRGCHGKIHFKNGKKVKLNEKSLRARFDELKI